jgi:hypothetical protein
MLIRNFVGIFSNRLREKAKHHFIISQDKVTIDLVKESDLATTPV